MSRETNMIDDDEPDVVYLEDLARDEYEAVIAVTDDDAISVIDEALSAGEKAA